MQRGFKTSIKAGVSADGRRRGSAPIAGKGRAQITRTPTTQARHAPVAQATQAPIALRREAASMNAAAVPSLADKAAANRRALVDRYKKMPPYNGAVRVGEENLNIKDGVLIWKSRQYKVSKDGRAVISDKGLLVGEIVNREMKTASAQFIEHMKQFGGVH